jgi:hypothetical protein
MSKIIKLDSFDFQRCGWQGLIMQKSYRIALPRRVFRSDIDQENSE